MQAWGPLAAFVSSATWAFASSRYAEQARLVGPELVNLTRALFALGLWGAALAVVHGTAALEGVSSTAAMYLAISIACSYGLGDGIFFAAAARIELSSALAIATTYPLWATLYGVLFRGEPFGYLRASGMLMCVVGVSSLLRLSGASASTARATSGAVVGVVLSLLVSLLWAGNAVFLKLGAADISVYQANALRFACGVLFILPQWWLRRARNRDPEVQPWSARRLVLPLVADTGIGSVCYVYGLANSDLAIGATLSSLSPLVALPLGAALGTERLTPGRVAAVCVTVAGVVLLVLS